MGHLRKGNDDPGELRTPPVLADWPPENGTGPRGPLSWHPGGPGAPVEREEEGVLLLGIAYDMAVLCHRDLSTWGGDPCCLEPGSIAAASRTPGDNPFSCSL